MPSYFNLHDFKEKHLTEIEHLTEIFPQIHPDNIALCLHENDCDFGLTISRLTMEISNVPQEKPNILIERQAKRNYNSTRTSKIPKPIEPLALGKKGEKPKKSLISVIKSDVSFSPLEVRDSHGEVMAGESEVKDCVIFEIDCSKYDRNIESPCVVFPFNVSSQIATMPISFP